LQGLSDSFEKVQEEGFPPVFLVGDAFGGSRAEGAFESGRLAGEALSQLLQ
jgi:predicted NAD/FAD-dependent oxidoreductase